MIWREGDELRGLTKPKITREQLFDYAEASGDRNPIHLDEKFAAEAGFPSVIVHGMLSMAFMADDLAFNFPAKEFTVVRLQGRFRKVTFPGDEISCGGTVKKIDPHGTLLISLWAKNQHGELTTEGEAEVVPKR